MSITEIVAVVGSAAGLLGGSGFFVARATVRAARVTKTAQEAVARIQAEPQAKAQDFAVLQATVSRVDEENRETRSELRRVGGLQRAYAWTVDRLIYRMERAGIPPEPGDIHELVREHMRTGA